MYVPWNEVVVLDPVQLSSSSSSSSSSDPFGEDCPAGEGGEDESSSDDDDDKEMFDHRRMRPTVLATWKNGFQVGGEKRIFPSFLLCFLKLLLLNLETHQLIEVSFPPPFPSPARGGGGRRLVF